MEILRTPAGRFSNLPGYPFEPHYIEVPDTAGGKLRIHFMGSSLKCMGNPDRDMIEIRDQEIEEVDTDRHERHGSFSIGPGFDTAVAGGVVCV